MRKFTNWNIRNGCKSINNSLLKLITQKGGEILKVQNRLKASVLVPRACNAVISFQNKQAQSSAIFLIIILFILHSFFFFSLSLFLSNFVSQYCFWILQRSPHFDTAVTPERRTIYNTYSQVSR